MKNQRGFGVMGIIALILVLGFITTTGWVVYSKKHQAKPKDYSLKQIQTYKFTPIALETSKWRTFNPFQGFTLKYPQDWDINDSGGFVTVTRRASGLISDTKTINITAKDTYFISKDVDIVADKNGYKRGKESGEISKGSRIRIYMEQRNESDSPVSPEDSCAYYRHQQTEILDFKSYKICQVQIADPSKQNVYGYQFIAHTNKMNYDLTLSFNPSSSSDEKDYFVSVAREIVASYKLY